MTDHDIDKVYQQQCNEIPSAQVDENILMMASQTCEKNTSSTRLAPKKYMPFTLAASIMFIGLLILNIPHDYLNDPDKLTPEQEPAHLPLKTSRSKEIMPMMDTNRARAESAPQSVMQSKKQRMTKNNEVMMQSEKRKLSNSSMEKLALLKQISESVIANKQQQAAVLANEYVDQFGIDQFPLKYHYLLK